MGFDIDETKFREVVYGQPIYEVINRAECLVRIESFAGDERNPTVYFKVTLVNDGDGKVNAADLTLLRQYFAYYDYDSNTPVYSLEQSDRAFIKIAQFTEYSYFCRIFLIDRI